MSGVRTPEEQAQAALEEAAGQIAEASEATSAIETGKIEDEAVGTLVDGVARALANGLDKPVGFYAAILGDESDYYSKTDIKQKIKDKSEEIASEDTDKQELDAFILDRLQNVTVHRNTDAKQGAKYTWDFGNFQVQTESGKDGRGHYSWPNFRNYIHESGGPFVGKPVKDRRSGDDWREFVSNLIEERGETRHITGKRTLAVEHLRNEITQQVGYGTPNGALDFSGIWVVVEAHDVPEWWQAFGTPLSQERDLTPATVREIRIHERAIEEATTDPDITRDALYQELDARSHTVPGSGGPSMQKYVDGTKERFWTLLPSIGTPRTYVPDPHAKGGTAGTLLDSLNQSEPEDEPTETTDNSGFDGVGEIA